MSEINPCCECGDEPKHGMMTEHVEGYLISCLPCKRAVLDSNPVDAIRRWNEENESYSLDDFLKDELGDDAKYFTSDGKNRSDEP